MSTTVKTGWLKDNNGDKLAPKTFINQVVDYDGITLEEKLENDKITAPLTADIGQQLIVKEVDESGKPIDWECVERPCYIEGERINILVDGLVDFQALSPQNVASCSVSIYDITLKPGNIYNITYNNVLYENLTLVDGRIGESADAALEYWYRQNKYYEYPFYITSASNDNYKWSIIFLCGERISRTEYFKIEEIEPIYVKLDNNYLEDNIPKINSAKVGQIIVVESVDENGKPNSFSVKNELDLSGYVKTTRYATESQVGLVRTSTSYGTKMSGQYIQTDKATASDISSKSNQYKPIVPYNLDYAIKCGLGANKLTWTEEEKTKARNVIGALGASDMIQSNWEQYDSSQLDYIKNRPFYNDYKYEDFSNVVDCKPETSSKTTYRTQQIHNYLLSPNLIEYIYLYTSSGVKLASLVYDSEDENYLYYKDTTEGYTLVVYKQSTEVSFLTKASTTKYNCTCNIRYITSTSIVPLDEKFIPNNIPKIATASVGQILEVEEIDDDGKPIKWKVVDKPSAVDGEDGFSPIATVEQTETGATISIKDKNGTTTATVKHGEDGNTPYIDEEGYIVYGSDEIIPVNVVKFDSQNLTENQKTQARENIGAVSLEEMSKLSREIADKGNPTDEQVKEAVNAYLEKNPIEGGTVPVSNSIKMAVTHPIGKLFETEYLYNSWVHNNVKYDSVNDKIVVLWSASSGHTNTDRRIMMAKINPRTFEAEIVKTIYDNGGLGADVATYGFEILDDGTYITFISVYGSEVENYGKVVACKSSDYGDSWTFVEVTAYNLPSNASYEFFGLTKLSTGRLLMIEYNTKSFMYSDDGGMTWECTTTSQKLHEPCFIEHSDGKTIVCYGRKTMYGTSNGEWNGTKQIEPALWWISTDGGTTWTAKGDSSTITEMTSSNCCASVNDGYIDLYVCSRLPHGDAFGVIYHYYASEDDAINDKWGTPKVALYPSCATGQDFSYIGCCLDSDKNTHIFYYDSDGVEGDTGIYYMIASKNPLVIPINADNTGVLALPYSMAKVNSLLQKLNATLTAKINKIVIQGGGNVGGGDNPDSGEDGDNDNLDTVMYTTDGLCEWWDFTDKSLYSEEDGTYTGLKNQTLLYNSKANWGIQALDDKTFTPKGARLYVGTFNKTNFGDSYHYSNGITIEVMQYVEVAHAITKTTIYPIYFSEDGKNYGYPQFNTCKTVIFIKYNKTDGTTLEGRKNSSKNSKDEYLTTGWKHWVITVNDVETKLYLNGELYTTVKYAEDFTDFESLYKTVLPQLLIASPYNNDNGLQSTGYTTTCRMYNKVLSEAEVKNNYQYEKVLFG